MHSLSCAALALCALPLLALAATPRTPLPAAECIQPSRINAWHIVDDRTAIVRTGPKYYEVTLQSRCPQLRHPPGLMFRSNASNASANEGRICGEAGETVRTTGQPPCAIQSVQRIDKARFEQLEKSAKATRQETRGKP